MLLTNPVSSLPGNLLLRFTALSEMSRLHTDLLFPGRKEAKPLNLISQFKVLEILHKLNYLSSPLKAVMISEMRWRVCTREFTETKAGGNQWKKTEGRS